MGPRRTITIRAWTTRGLIGAAALGAAAWALAPRDPYDPIELDLSVPPAAFGERDRPAPFDIEPFDAALVWPPRADEPRPEERPRRVACALQLIGIVTSADGLRSAILYDPSTDTLHQAALGESVGAFEVASVGLDAVVVTGDGASHTLSLETGREDG